MATHIRIKQQVYVGAHIVSWEWSDGAAKGAESLIIKTSAGGTEVWSMPNVTAEDRKLVDLWIGRASSGSPRKGMFNISVALANKKKGAKARAKK